MPQTICFYRVSDACGYLSNFAPYPIEVDGQTWPTSEHYFQAQKFEDKQHQEVIRTTHSPIIAARMGRDRQRPLRPDWETVKLDVMRRCVLAKFSQHDELRMKLLATGEAEIVEHTEKDHFWGDGGDGSGMNMLGKILMEVRGQLHRGPLP